MKKLPVIFAICILASCVQIEEGLSDEIPLGFDVYSARRTADTKADANTYVPTGTGHLPSGSQFGVFGYHHTAIGNNVGSWSDANPNHPNLMYNQPVTVSESAGVYSYSYSPKRYWPRSEKETLSFFAYYPYRADATNTSNGPVFRAFLNKDSNGMGYIRYLCSENPAEQVDFLLSDLCMDQNKAAGILTGSALDGDGGKVRFTFHHMLSMVRVQVANVNSENPKITVDEDSYSFAFFGFPIAANCTPTPGAKDPATGLAQCSFVWSAPLSTVTYTQGQEIITRDSKMEVPLYEGAADYSDFLLIIPHEVEDNERLEVSFDMVRAGTNEHYSYKDNPLSANLKGQIDEFLPGKIYTFSINASLNAISFNTTVTDWTSGTGDFVLPISGS